MSDGASLPAFRPREIRLWWPVPLAAILWLAIVWKFGYFLIAPRVEMAAPVLIKARFVELPEAAAGKSQDDQPKSPSRQGKPGIKPRSDALPIAGIAPSKPAMPTTEADPEPASDMAPPADMMSYVEAAKARRQAAEMFAVRMNAEAAARERGPSSDGIRMANIMRNLQPQGTNGVFQIVGMGVRTGKFSFRGWTKDASDSRRELIEVDAGPNGDVERAIVRGMIELIRKYYKGDFNWESQRLDRVIVLSARVEDNEGLEDFLIREFFATGAGSRGTMPRNGYPGQGRPFASKYSLP